MEQDQDRHIIEAVLAGDTQAFSQIVKQYQRAVYYLVLRMLKNPESADEITQKTFLKAYQALHGFQYKSSLKTWLIAIALNLCRTELGKARREAVELPPDLPDPEFGNRAEREELQHRKQYLHQALESLPLRQREVVTLRIYQELSFKEIAHALDSTESAVKVNFHHAMKSLREWTQKRIRHDAV